MTDRRSALLAWTAGLAMLALAAAAGGLVVRRLARVEAVAEAAAVAERAGASDRVAALIARASGGDQTPRRRTRAVWALGELRDPRALPALERLHVQEACDHDRLVCQREVRLAIAKIRGELTLRATLARAWHDVRARVGRRGEPASGAPAAPRDG